MATYDFSGIWRSSFTYKSSKSGDKEFTVEHYSIIHQKGNRLVIESLPKADSYRVTRLTLDGRIGTGTWEQQNSEDSSFQGVRYWGVAQVVVDEDGKGMRGKWAGFGRNMQVKTGPWEIVRIGKSISDIPKDTAK